METTLGVKIEPRDAERGAAVIDKELNRLKLSARGLREGFLDAFSSKVILGGGIVAGLTTVGVALMGTSRAAVAYNNEIKDLAQQTSLATKEASALAYAASLNGTNTQALSAGLSRLNQNMTEVASGTGDGARLFKALGVSVTDTNGRMRQTSDVFLDVVDHLQTFNEDGAKTTVINKLLGAGMQDMARAGKDAIMSQIQEAERLGRTIDDSAIAKTEAWEKSTARLQASIKGLGTDLGTALLPAMTATADITHKLIEDLRAGPALIAGFMNAGKGDAPQIGVTRAEGSARNLLRLPAPTGLETAVVDKNPAFDPSLAGGLGKEHNGHRLFFDDHVKEYQKYSMEQLQLLFTGANSMRKEVESDVERLIEDLKHDNQRTIDLITKDFAGDTHGERQEAAGRRIIKSTQEENARKEREQLIENEQAWVHYGEQVGGSQEFFLQHRLELVRLNLGKELDLNQETAGRLLIAWQNHDEDLAQHLLATSTKTSTEIETIQLRALGQSKKLIKQSSDDVFSGWANGMQTYMDSKDGLGMGADMARRAAQGMEQGFQKFFFDGMEGKFKGFKDVLTGVLDFTKQIISQMAAQMATVGIIKPVAAALASLFGGNTTPGPLSINGSALTTLRFGGVVPIEHFAAGGVGGITHRPQHMALGRTIAEFGEGPQAEAFVPLPDGRSIPVTLTLANAMPMAQATGSGAVSNTINITVHADSTQPTTSQAGTAGPAPNFAQLARDLSKLVEAKLVEEQRPGGLLARGVA
ncbi:MAG: hypothetical protein ABL970_00965 [Nitrospira sp.]